VPELLAPPPSCSLAPRGAKNKPNDSVLGRETKNRNGLPSVAITSILIELANKAHEKPAPDSTRALLIDNLESS
jgi:hypothetical protein